MFAFKLFWETMSVIQAEFDAEIAAAGDKLVVINSDKWTTTQKNEYHQKLEWIYLQQLI